jgi:toxin-antitoxin system PIN domain toxin
MTARATATAPGGAGDLPDLNVWLALALVEHPHHRAAQAYWYETAARRIWFCRVTMLGLVRLLTQPKLMGKASLGLRDAFDLYLRFAALPEVGSFAEPPDCESKLAHMLDPNMPARLWTNAYLAAFAASGNLRLVTFDKDFARFEGIQRLQLSLR